MAESGGGVDVLVFARTPALARVKTRLIPRLGAAGAALLHVAMVERALDTAIASRIGRVTLHCHPDTNNPCVEHWCTARAVGRRAQRGADLGARMGTALADAHAERRAALVIGGDCPGLDVTTLRTAARALDRHDAVLGPARDGGYYLIGLAVAAPPALFSGMPWGTSRVAALTRERLAAAGLRWAELGVRSDIDDPRDLERLDREIWPAGAPLSMSGLREHLGRRPRAQARSVTDHVQS